MAWILVVDDEPAVGRAIKRYLQSEGFEPVVVQSLRDARSVLQVRPINLVLLDLRIGNRKSFDFARIIEDRYDTPVIFVTGSDELADKVTAFDLGAYDYVTKPFEIGELLARVRSVLRRTEQSGAATNAERESRFRIGERVYDFKRWTVDPPMKLTRFEFRLMKLLALSQGAPVTREQISLAINRRSHHPADRTIDVIVSKLRTKIGSSLIQTIRGEGYALGVEAEALDDVELPTEASPEVDVPTSANDAPSATGPAASSSAAMSGTLTESGRET